MDKIHIYLSMFAALVLLVVGLLRDIAFNELAVLFIIVVVASYIVGLIVRGYLRKTVFFEEPEPDETEEIVTYSGEEAEFDDEEGYDDEGFEVEDEEEI